MQTLTLKAPAKVNLYLHVLNKRPDGYHNIETIFEKIDLCDEITLRKRKQGIRIICGHKDVPGRKQNLCFQAAQAFLAKTNRTDGLEIKIAKRIPVAAGLGGGSSDAGCVLLGLNRLFATGLTRRKLQGIAEKLGADVPFFLLRSSRAIGQGKGEILTPLQVKRRNWYVLVIPRLKVSSRRMYQHPRIALTKRPANAKIVACALQEDGLTALHKYSYNSFEPILRKKYHEIQKIKKALKSSGVTTSFMSGSGPCVFGVAKNRKEAMDISAKLRNLGKTWQVIVTKTYANSKKEE